MTIIEYQKALDDLDDPGFEKFRTAFGGSFSARQQYVDDFVHNPIHERRICQLLKLKTEAEKMTEAALVSAKAAGDSAHVARWSMIWAAFSMIISLAALAFAVFGKLLIN